MYSLYLLIDTILMLFMWVLIAHVILSWLIAFKIINTYNKFVSMVGSFLYRFTEPALQPIRRFVPVVGGLDLSVLILLLIIWFSRNLLAEYWGSSVRVG